jgi:hypothetical protein
MIRTIMYPTDMAVTTMEAGIMVMGVVMGEEEGIGTTIQMAVMRIVGIIAARIALGEVVVAVDAVNWPPL